MRAIGERLTYANVAVTVMIFVVLGGTALAVLGKNSVGSRQIKKNAVKAAEIAANSVGAAELKDGAVGTADVADGSIGANDLASGVAGIASESDPHVMFATVTETGDLVATKGALDADKVDAGNHTYRVSFARDVSGCAYTATPQAGIAFQAAAVAPRADVRNVQVDLEASGAFHLHVICP